MKPAKAAHNGSLWKKGADQRNIYKQYELMVSEKKAAISTFPQNFFELNEVYLKRNPSEMDLLR